MGFDFSFILPFKIFSQNYNVALIPDSLKQNAHCVKRYDETYVKIKGIDKAVITHKVAYTVLDEAGDYFARYGNYYDKFHSLSDISGKLFDAAGKVLKSIKKKIFQMQH